MVGCQIMFCLVITRMMMVFKIVVFLLLITTFCNGNVKNKPIFGHNISNLHTNHSVTTIQSEDGDIIECINIYKQPAFKHPALRNHKIQMAPSYNHQTTEQPRRTSFTKQMKEDLPRTITTQTWHRSGSCPRGTIPIRGVARNKKNRKKPIIFLRDKGSGGDEKLYLLHRNRSLAILHTEGFSYLGAKGDIRVHNPHVQSDDEYSTSQVTLSGGGPYNAYEEIQSGWAVNPSVYRDRRTRFFIYWTVDGSNNTGCFDLTCPGFVQTSHEIALGAAIHPITSPNGQPHEISLYIHQDPFTSNWWVQYGEKIIGYWPSELFKDLKYHAKTVQWGGEVYSGYLADRRPHTTTAMGSGYFPDIMYGTSGYVKRMRILGNSMELVPPSWAYPYTDEYTCYDIFYLNDYSDDPEFYFGGPGRNKLCP